MMCWEQRLLPALSRPFSSHLPLLWCPLLDTPSWAGQGVVTTPVHPGPLQLTLSSLLQHTSPCRPPPQAAV